MDLEWFFYGVYFFLGPFSFLFIPVHSITTSHETNQQQKKIAKIKAKSNNNKIEEWKYIHAAWIHRASFYAIGI